MAIAAAAALAFFLTSPPATEARDVNRDGRFDVLDAYKLARGVESGVAPPTWDLDSNGVVDARYADFAAAVGAERARQRRAAKAPSAP